MKRLLESKVLYVTVCALFALAICANTFAGGSLPAFNGKLVPEISHGPVPPPDPDVHGGAHEKGRLMIVRTVVERDLATLQIILIPETAVEKAVLGVIPAGTRFTALRPGDESESVVLVLPDPEKAPLKEPRKGMEETQPIYHAERR